MPGCDSRWTYFAATTHIVLSSWIVQPCGANLLRIVGRRCRSRHRCVLRTVASMCVCEWLGVLAVARAPWWEADAALGSTFLTMDMFRTRSLVGPVRSSSSLARSVSARVWRALSLGCKVSECPQSSWGLPTVWPVASGLSRGIFPLLLPVGDGQTTPGVCMPVGRSQTRSSCP